MKKIFTLISVALCAISVNAQTEVKTFSVSNGDFTTDKHWQYVQVKDGDKSFANFEILSSPNSDQLYNDNRDECDENTTPTFDKSKYKEGAQIWLDAKQGAKKNENESLEALNELYKDCLIGQGNPQFNVVESWEYGKDGWAFKVNGEEWTEGCGSLPGQGEYLRITPIVDGTVQIGVYINKGGHALYIIDESTKAAGYTLLPVSAVKVVGGYFQNNGWEGNYKAEGLTAEGKIPDGKTYKDLVDYLNTWEMPADRIIQNQSSGTIGRPFMGIIEFDVKKGVSYIIMNPKSQVGFYGFAYAYDKAAADAEQGLPTPTDPTTGVKEIKNVSDKYDANAPIYNLAGQKVSKDFKGVKVQNGKKFF